MANNIDRLILQRLPIGGWVIAYKDNRIFCDAWQDVLKQLLQLGV